MAEVAILGGLAYMGYRAFKTPEGALLGPISLKLATTAGGFPSVSQIAGIVGLGSLGLAFVTTQDDMERYASGAGIAPPDLSPKDPDPETGGCPPNHTKIWSERAGTCICIHNNLVTPFQQRCP